MNTDHPPQSTPAEASAPSPAVVPPPPTMQDKARLTLHGLLEEMLELAERRNDSQPMAWDYFAMKAEELQRLGEEVAAHIRSDLRFTERLEASRTQRSEKMQAFFRQHFPERPLLQARR